MLAYIARRFLLAAFTIWTITVLAFVIIQIPEGDAVDRFLDLVIAGGMGIDSEGVSEELRNYLGLDQPQYIRYLKWISSLAQGDLGPFVPVGLRLSAAGGAGPGCNWRQDMDDGRPDGGSPFW